MAAEIKRWEPEDHEFWTTTGRGIAWRTLVITTASLVLSFATWFVMSAVVVRLPYSGFPFNTMQLFWLAALPGLAGGILRIINTFLIPIFGTRKVIAIATFLKVFPCAGLALAVMNPETPFWVFALLAFSFGLGGGDFSSYMPSTSLFFPKRLQGLALGIQAGIGNFGVSLTQFITPWVMGFAVFGALSGTPQLFTKGAVSKPIFLQNAALWYIPLLLILTALAWAFLRRVPVRATFREQLDIFGNKHTWIFTSLYIMTFSSFAGYSASFPLLIREVYGGFPDAPDPLKYAFWGPLVGSLIRAVVGPLADKWGGGKLTHISGIGLFICALGVMFYTTPQVKGEFPLFVAMMLGLFFFSGIGNASTFRQMPIVFQPRQAAGVLGWTAAIASFGPFVFASLFGIIITKTGNPNLFFGGAALFYLVNIWLNWHFYTRRKAEAPC